MPLMMAVDICMFPAVQFICYKNMSTFYNEISYVHTSVVNFRFFGFKFWIGLGVLGK